MHERLRIGVIGCGLIAQVMHLHYLRELADRFEIAALCDVSEELARACAEDYGVAKTFARWQDLLAAPVDAVLILTSGSHAPIAIAAAEAGKHMLVEKPMCFSVAEGRAMIEASRRAGVTLMVGYNKRYDPAYQRLGAEIRSLSDLRLLQVTTLESPLQPYVAHYRLHRAPSLPPELAKAFADDNQARITAAIGDADSQSRQAYHLVLLDSMVHEFNAVRGILGEPDRLDFADIRQNGLTVVLRFGAAECIIAWVDLPGIARYAMEIAFYAPERRLTLAFPSPFLRSMPTLLKVEGGDAASSEAWCNEHVVSYAESFKEELIHFHECITSGRPPLTSGEDALRDIALCEAIVHSHLARRPQERPTDAAASRSRIVGQA
jgi:predicted dehydrogenase